MDWTRDKNGSGKELRKYLRVNWKEVEGEDRLRWLEDVEKNLQEMKVQRRWQGVTGIGNQGGQGSQRAIQPSKYYPRKLWMHFFKTNVQ